MLRRTLLAGALALALLSFAPGPVQADGGVDFTYNLRLVATTSWMNFCLPQGGGPQVWPTAPPAPWGPGGTTLGPPVTTPGGPINTRPPGRADPPVLPTAHRGGPPVTFPFRGY